MTLKTFLVGVLLVLAGLDAALAQAFPTRPITLVMPYGAGSNIDVMIRAVATEAATNLGQSIVVENKPGALTRLGVEQLKRAAPDGYLLTVASDGIAVTQPIADPEFRFEVGRDYAPVSLIASFPLVLAANPATKASDLKSLLALAKQNPGKLNMAGGPGSISHIAFERFNRLIGNTLTFIPYKDSAQAIPDLMAGRVDLVFGGSLLKSQIDGAKLVGLATTGASRWSVYPQIPTLREFGIDMTAMFWMGIVAPAGTPKEVVGRLNAAFSTALRSESVSKRMTEFGMSGGPALPDQFADFIRSEVTAWTPVIRGAGITIR